MTKTLLHTSGAGFINSYSQLFFANSKVFAWMLLASSFVNPVTGLSGLIATLTAILFSWWIGLDRHPISHGTFSYNALMIGLVLGSQYNFTWSYVLLLMFSSVMSVLMVVALNTFFAKYKLPSLSLSFIFTLWLVTIGMRGYSNMELSETGLFRLNEWYGLGGSRLVEWMYRIENASLPEFLIVYLKSLSAVFFQYNIISGGIILAGLIIWSRIAFLLSLIGFTLGYLFYYSMSGEFSQLYYSYIGFNFILTAISLGGFYVIPSRASFLLAIISMPLIGILISGLGGIIAVYQLPLYSLPFSVTVILILLLLHQRVFSHRLTLVPYQYFSPEKNLYAHTNNALRFQKNHLVRFQLPFFGEWYVSQGYNGKITHKEEWSEALDFVVVDETQHTFKLPGELVSDFLCYNLPVLAPADGYVTEVVDGIDDNAPGDVNVQENWGNTVVIKHGDGLYSKLSHLKKNSLTVRLNDFVKAGQVIATCGSSGRSPEPHLHFQLQSTPYIGSPTLAYPIGYYVSRQSDTYTFHDYDTPAEGMHIHNPVRTPLLQQALHFIPGRKLHFETMLSDGTTEKITWECGVTAYNQSYLYCSESGSVAYFINDGAVFYFTGFEGSERSLLFDFYMGAQRVLMGYYEQMPVHDSLAVPRFHSPYLLWFQDWVAPFYRFLDVKYESAFVSIDNLYAPDCIVMKSRVTALFGNRIVRERTYEFTFREHKLAQWNIIRGDKRIQTITCTD